MQNTMFANKVAIPFPAAVAAHPTLSFKASRHMGEDALLACDECLDSDARGGGKAAEGDELEAGYTVS
jgi:hypothetical protein